MDPAQARDIRMLLVKVLGEGLVFHLTGIDWRQRVNVSVLLRGDGIPISIIVNVVKIIIVLQLFASVRILLQPSAIRRRKKGKFSDSQPVIRLF